MSIGHWPRPFLVVFFIGTGILFILLLNPFHSVCDTQEELFREEVKRIFFVDRNLKAKGFRSNFEQDLEKCGYANSPGGCFDLFQDLRKLESEIEPLTQDCAQHIGHIGEVREAFGRGIEMMVRLAWGGKTPETYMEKTGWLGESDLYLFCRLKRQSIRVYGENYWNRLFEKQLAELIQMSQLSKSETLSRSLLSLNCRSYQ